MKKICSYCRAHYGETGQPPPPGLPEDAVTHGICPACVPIVEKEIAAAGRRHVMRRIVAFLLGGW
jgi:hypothetical protein